MVVVLRAELCHTEVSAGQLSVMVQGKLRYDETCRTADSTACQELTSSRLRSVDTFMFRPCETWNGICPQIQTKHSRSNRVQNTTKPGTSPKTR